MIFNKSKITAIKTTLYIKSLKIRHCQLSLLSAE
nr:MAG TPA: hypothetical protein [Caudoviricetes sp.]